MQMLGPQYWTVLLCRCSAVNPHRQQGRHNSASPVASVVSVPSPMTSVSQPWPGVQFDFAVVFFLFFFFFAVFHVQGWMEGRKDLLCTDDQTAHDKGWLFDCPRIIWSSILYVSSTFIFYCIYVWHCVYVKWLIILFLRTDRYSRCL